MKLITGTSTDYNLFIYSEMNRPINNGHVKNLIDSIQKRGNISIISCRKEVIDGKEYYQILDGQHRFKACQILEIPIQYAIWEGVDDTAMSSLNENQEKWTLANYLHFGMVYNKENSQNDYLKLSKYVSETKISIASLINIFDFHDSQSKHFLKLRSARFKAGIWEMTSEKEGKEILATLKYIGDTYNLENAYNSKIIAAAPRMFFHPHFNKKRFIEQAKICPNPLAITFSSESDSLYELERIYNYNVDDPSKKVIFLKRELSGANARKIEKIRG